MMKKTILFMLLACTSVMSIAQTSSYRKRGYKGDVTFGVNADLSCNGGGVGLFTTHGFQLNKTWFVGGGIGYENDMLPLYFDAKAYFLERRIKVDPWVEIKFGVDAVNSGCYISPSFGITLPLPRDYGLTIGLAYGCNAHYDERNIGLRIGFQF